MFPFKTGGVLYVFNTEKAQRLLANVVNSPESANITGESIRVRCIVTFANAFVCKMLSGYSLDGYYSQDAEILYNAIIAVSKKERLF